MFDHSNSSSRIGGCDGSSGSGSSRRFEINYNLTQAAKTTISVSTLSPP